MLAIRDALHSQMGNNSNLELVPMSSWITKVEAHDEADITRVPALKLISFFKGLADGDARLRAEMAVDSRADDGHNREALGLPMLSIDKMQARSDTLLRVRPLESADVAKWVEYWLHRASLFSKDEVEL